MSLKTYILKLDKADEEKEIEFELNYLMSLSIEERFLLMEEKSKQIKKLLEQNGHRRPDKIIKRV